MYRRSLPTRGAWIETSCSAVRLTPTRRRSPHGERGLKQLRVAIIVHPRVSLPTRGAWIETS